MTIRKVDFGGWSAMLLTECTDHKSKNLVSMSFIGTKSAVKVLTSRLRSKDNQGGPGSDPSKFAFFVQDEDGEPHSFKLKDDRYTVVTQPLPVPDALSVLPRVRRPALYEARITSFDALVTAGKDLCYVPVWNQIKLVVKTFGGLDERTTHQWREYLAGQFQAAWCDDLRNVFEYLSSRVRVPMHPSWAPWLLHRATTAEWSINNKAVKPARYLSNWVAPEILDQEKALGRPVVEHGYYAVVCDEARDQWRNLIWHQSNRYDGLEFSKIPDVEPPAPVAVEDDAVDGDAGEIFD